MGMRNGVSQPYGLPDLDPLGLNFPNVGGGMLFDPLRRPMRPRVGPLPPRYDYNIVLCYDFVVCLLIILII